MPHIRPGGVVRLLCALLLCVGLLAGCHRSDLQNIGRNMAYYQEPESGLQRVDILTYDHADFADSLGFAVALPTAPAAGKFFVIEGWYAQIEFEMEDTYSLSLRVAPTLERSLSGSYSETHYAGSETRQIDGIEVRIQQGRPGCVLATWQVEDYQYALHSSKYRGPVANEVLEAMVRQARAVPAKQA